MANPPRTRTIKSSALPQASRTEIVKPIASVFTKLGEAALKRQATLFEVERGVDDVIDAETLHGLIAERQVSLTRIYHTIEGFRPNLLEPLRKRPVRFPATLRGQIVNPDGTPGGSLSVTMAQPAGSEGAWPTRRVVTNPAGLFSLDLPDLPMPSGDLHLTIGGANGSDDLTLRNADVASGDVGLQVLSKNLSALHQSIVASLKQIAADWGERDAAQILPTPADASADKPLAIGEGDCARIYAGEGGTLSQYQFGIFFRLVEPALGPHKKLWAGPLPLERQAESGTVDRVAFQAGAKNAIYPISGSANAFNTLPLTITPAGITDILGRLGKWTYADRAPIDAPIDVAAFHDEVIQSPRTLPKAATLGLGYVVRMNNVAIMEGYVRGNLVYSLPLAPGEEQRIAVVEREDRVTVQEREAMTYDEDQAYNEAAASDMEDTFSSAFDEAVNASSKMHSESKSGSFGLGTAIAGVGKIYGFNVMSGGGASGGYGAGSTTGSSSSSQDTSRDFVSRAAQSFSSNLARKASLKRRATRTSIRTATTSSREESTTRIIANRNHSHALTMQWFEVLRRFTVTTQVDGVDLVCLVPMELIPFAQPNQPSTLPTDSYSRGSLLIRYSMLARYLDVLGAQFPAGSIQSRGMEALRRLVSNPLMELNPADGDAADVINTALSATALPMDMLRIQAVTKRGDIIGPVTLQGAIPAIDPMILATRDDVLSEMQRRRRDGPPVPLAADLILPNGVSRADIVRFEILHSFSDYAYPLKGQSSLDVLKDLGQVFTSLENSLETLLTAKFTASELATSVGGPRISGVSATLKSDTSPDKKSYVAGALGDGEIVTDRIVLPAHTMAPILSFDELLAIEAAYQHIVSRTVDFSTIIWASLSDGERAIMLEPYTIGVPTGGFTDASQAVPLLSCVTNQVLGFFGNCMMMPFSIPPALATAMDITTGEVQDALMRFHREGFSPTRTTLTLPTRGVLGEAMLGQCNASEKIDITRFWNWQDSPSPSADPVTFRAQGADAGALSAPSVLGPVATPPTSIAISNGAAPTGTNLLAEVLKAAPDLAQAGADRTGLAQLAQQLGIETGSAAGGRDKAIDQAADLTKAAMNGALQAYAIEQGMNPFGSDKKAEDKGDAKSGDAKSGDAKGGGDAKPGDAAKGDGKTDPKAGGTGGTGGAGQSGGGTGGKPAGGGGG